LPAPSAGPGSGANPLDGFSIGGGGIAPFGLIDGGIGAFEGLDWAVPALFLTVPGLLLIFAVSAQLFAGVLWLPVARRWLGGFGVGRRRRRERDQPS